MVLSVTRSLFARCFLNRVQSSLNANVIRAISIKVVEKQPDPIESHDEKNLRLNRMMSPHLTIYKPQLTTMLSISHRFAGVILTGYASALGIGALVLTHDFSHYITMIEGLQMNSATLFTLKLIIGFPAVYHTCNGVRHLFWDSGRLLKIREVYSSGYIMLGSSVALSILLALL